MPAASSANCRKPSTSEMPPGIAPTMPRDAEMAYEVSDKLMPSTSGPRVMAAQYTSMRCATGRGLGTRQMALSVPSIVNTSARAVTNKINRPNPPS